MEGKEGRREWGKVIILGVFSATSKKLVKPDINHKWSSIIYFNKLFGVKHSQNLFFFSETHSSYQGPCSSILAILCIGSLLHKVSHSSKHTVSASPKTGCEGGREGSRKYCPINQLLGKIAAVMWNPIMSSWHSA